MHDAARKKRECLTARLLCVIKFVFTLYRKVIGDFFGGDLAVRFAVVHSFVIRYSLLLGMLTLGIEPAAGAELDVTIMGIRPGAGSVRVALYHDPSSFRHEDRAVAVLSAPAQHASVKVAFQGIPAGRYAVLAYHDKNDNGKLDLTMRMFPREGWGLSNNPHVFGPPRFEPSAFEVTEPYTNIAVPLHY
jgi:uncharacterized protein (DUF2141 family)